MYVCRHCKKIITYDCCIEDVKGKYPSDDEVLDLDCVHAELVTEIDWKKLDEDKKCEITLKIKCPECNQENFYEVSLVIDPLKNRNKKYFLL